MKKHYLIPLVSVLPLLLAGLILAGCKALKTNDPTMQITKIEYRFGDSSVPPPYHRSYSIVLTPDSIHTVVDSYGDIVGEGTAPLTDAAFNDIVAAIDTFSIRRCTSVRKEHGCTGGTTESVSYWEGEKEAFSASVYHCGGDDYGSLCGRIKAFADKVRKLVPDFESLLAR